MISKNTQERGSTKKEKGILSVPELIHENNSTTLDFCWEALTSIKIKTATTKEASTEMQAMAPDILLLIFLPKNPLIKKPIKGNRGTRPINFIINA